MSEGFRSWICQFPTSLAVEGEACYARMAEAGFERTLFCAVIYAPYRLVLPRYPQRGIYSLEEGCYYHQPDAARYRDLLVQPAASGDFAGRDLVAESVAGARRAGLEPGAWLTVFANGAIAKQHPDWAVHNLYGSADRLYLCLNHPEVIEYSLRVAEELAERYELAEVMLDKIPQTCLELNSLAGRIDPVLRTVGSFCFCDHCARVAATAGIDLADCRRRALALAAESLAIPPHIVNALAAELQGDTEIPLLLVDHPWIMDLLRFRMECIKKFVGDVRRRVEARRPGVRLSAAFVPPVKIGHDAASPRAWLGAQSYAAYRDAALDLIHSVVHWGPDVVEYDTRRAVGAVAPGAVRICTHVRAYGPTRPEELAALVGAARRGGAAGVGYFAYDLMTEEMLAAAKRCHGNAL